MLCPNCKSNIDDDSNVCKYCGNKIIKKNKNPIEMIYNNLNAHVIISMILTWIIPGLGHFLMKLYWKGIVVFLLFYGIEFLSGFYPAFYGIKFNYIIIEIIYKIILLIDLYYCYIDINNNKKYPGLI